MRGASGTVGCAALALTIASGVYLFNIEKDVICFPLDKDGNSVDVALQWKQVLIILFSAQLCQLVFGCISLIKPQFILPIVGLPALLEFAGWIFLLVVRFNSTGKICAGSGDNINSRYYGELHERG